MIPWQHLDSVPTPDGLGEMTLHRRGDEFAIRVDRNELMNSRQHGSEEAMAELACDGLRAPEPRVLVGGLGMGFTVAAACRSLPLGATIDVAELVPAVVRWNRGDLGACAGRPLDDPRVHVLEGDVCALLDRSDDAYDAILLDVDNGPDGLTQRSNGWLYSATGLARVRRALRAGGVLSVWSVQDDPGFTKRLRRARFDAVPHTVRTRKGGPGGRGKGAKHTVWIARRD